MSSPASTRCYPWYRHRCIVFLHTALMVFMTAFHWSQNPIDPHCRTGDPAGVLGHPSDLFRSSSLNRLLGALRTYITCNSRGRRTKCGICHHCLTMRCLPLMLCFQPLCWRSPSQCLCRQTSWTFPWRYNNQKWPSLGEESGISLYSRCFSEMAAAFGCAVGCIVGWRFGCSPPFSDPNLCEYWYPNGFHPRMPCPPSEPPTSEKNAAVCKT